MNKRFIAVAASVLAVGITAAYAAGSFSTLPIVGSGSYCASTVSGVASPSNAPYLVPPGSTQGTGSSICGQTVPAGPTQLLGNEIVPADTNTPGGNIATSTTFYPSTVAVPIILTDSGAWGLTVPLTNTAYTATQPTNGVMIVPAGTLAQFTVTFPSNPLFGQQFHVASTQTITALYLLGGTVAGAGGGVATITQTPTILTSSTTAPEGYSWIWGGNTIGWVRVQ